MHDDKLTLHLTSTQKFRNNKDSESASAHERGPITHVSDSHQKVIDMTLGKRRCPWNARKQQGREKKFFRVIFLLRAPREIIWWSSHQPKGRLQHEQRRIIWNRKQQSCKSGKTNITQNNGSRKQWEIQRNFRKMRANLIKKTAMTNLA